MRTVTGKTTAGYRRFAGLAAALILTGCAGAGPTAAPQVIEADKQVSVRCVAAAPVRPAYATESLTSAATDIQYGDALAGDWVLSRGYEAELEAAVGACIK